MGNLQLPVSTPETGRSEASGKPRASGAVARHAAKGAAAEGGLDWGRWGLRRVGELGLLERGFRDAFEAGLAHGRKQ